MTINIICLSLILTLNFDFFNEVLKNHNRNNSCYIGFKVISQNYKGKVIIKNNDFFWFYKKTLNKNEKDYISFTKEIFTSGNELNIKEFDITNFKFIKVSNNKVVKKQVHKGSENFINYFFENRVLKDEFQSNISVKNEIIYELFNFKVATSEDDETGYLYIKLLNN
jgi:hypothetical protein